MSDSAVVDNESSFSAHVRSVVERFLQTVVLVDDLASFSTEEEIGPLDEPTPETAVQSAVEESGDAPSRPKEPLDAKSLVEAFGRRGLVCSVLRPTRDDVSGEEINEFFQSFLAASAAADVVVLDWVIHDDQGSAAISLLKELIERDQQGGRGRLRLVAIYTGEPDLTHIFDRLSTELESSVEESSNDSEKGIWIRCGGLHVSVLAKEGVHVDAEFNELRVSVENLPFRIVQEFTRLTHGLIPAFALSCLAIVREDAHYLLKRFNSRLDAPFLTHRIYTSDDDAQDFAVHLLASELKALLDASEASKELRAEVIELWLDERLASSPHVSGGDGSPSHQQIRDLVRKGFEDGRPEGMKKSVTSVTGLFCDSTEVPEDLDHEFGRLSCLARNYPEPYPRARPPLLTIGTVIARQRSEDWEYFLCVQPACDAVRLTDITQFAFLPLREHSQSFDIVALGPNNAKLYLKLAVGVRDLLLTDFQPSDGKVRATQSELGYQFNDSNSDSYVWVGQLRDFQAQRHASQISGEIGRPGGDDYEWLRRSAR
ncbi:MAG: hypothetical protein QOG54_1347 [Actinomycetota bacterium]|jgi:hypothetical protein|nr:hypothetical protein [Actinomycetota bacterium]